MDYFLIFPVSHKHFFMYRTSDSKVFYNMNWPFNRDHTLFLVGYLTFSVLYASFLAALELAGINRSYNDEFLLILIVPLLFSALYYSRAVYFTSAGITLFVVMIHLAVINEDFIHDYKVVFALFLAVLVLLEILYQDGSYRRRIEEERNALNEEYKKSLDKIRMLSEMLPICSVCKKISTNETAWLEFESYLRNQLKTEIVHSLCEECVKKFVREFSDSDETRNAQDMLERFYPIQHETDDEIKPE